MMNIIFDVDGTLVESYALDAACFVQAVRDVLGDVHIHEDWRAYRHVTDAGILSQICAENRCAADDAPAVRQRFAELLQAQFEADPFACPAIPGAGHMLSCLWGRARVGIATGGWAMSAALKLDQAGIVFEPSALFSSDDAMDRIGIMRACFNAVGDPGAETVYVGDAEWDLVATQELGWHLIGVGPRLQGRAELWVADFEGPDFARHVAELSAGALRL